MEIRQLQYFIEIVKYKSFSKAASALYVTQPTLTISIKQLEEELGLTLIERKNRNFKLTEMGEVFYRRACDVYDKFNDLNNIADETQSAIHGSVTIGTAVLANPFFDKLLLDFSKQYPGVSIHIVEKTSKEILEGISAQRFDLGLVLLPAGDLRGCEVKVISNEPMYACVTRDDPLSEKKQIAVSDLKDRGLILFNDDYQPHLDLINLCKREGFFPNIVFSFPRITMLLDAVRLRSGITVVPESYIREYMEPDYSDLVIKPLQPEIKRKAAIIYSKDRYRPKAMLKLLEYTLDYFSVSKHRLVRKPEHRQSENGKRAK